MPDTRPSLKACYLNDFNVAQADTTYDRQGAFAGSRGQVHVCGRHNVLMDNC